MAVKVAINGFGRIGRLAFRQMFGAEGFEIDVYKRQEGADAKLPVYRVLCKTAVWNAEIGRRRYVFRTQGKRRKLCGKPDGRGAAGRRTKYRQCKTVSWKFGQF